MWLVFFLIAGLLVLFVIPDDLKFQIFMLYFLNAGKAAFSLCNLFTFMLRKIFFFLSQNQLGTCSRLFVFLFVFSFSCYILIL